MAGVDVNRTTSGVNLPASVASEIWADTLESSVIMNVARRINLPGPGVSIPSITGEPVAEWVAETAKKPVSRPTFGNKTITPYKLAVIVPFSMEFRRDASSLYNECIRRLPNALGKAFDETVLGTTTAPGANFDKLSSSTLTATVDGTNTLADLVAAYQAIAAAGGDLSHWIANPTLVGLLISAQSQTEGFNLGSGLQVGSVFGAPVLKTKTALPTGAGATDDVLGYAGPFSTDAVYGTVEGVQVSVSDQATLTDGAGSINLWEQNMFAVRAEIEVGFRVKDVDKFLKINDGSADSEGE